MTRMDEYWSMVADAADEVDHEDVIIPLDTLTNVSAHGFCVDTFQDDVLDYIEAIQAAFDAQLSLF